MIKIQVKPNVRLPVEKTILIKSAQTALELTEYPKDSDVSIIIGNDALLRRLNARYRHVDEITDVLSFATGEVDPDTKVVYLGDVIISLPRAQEQASAAGHPVADELQLLVVHGILHLLGYDHTGDHDTPGMQATQDRILEALGVHVISNL